EGCPRRHSPSEQACASRWTALVGGTLRALALGWRLGCVFLHTLRSGSWGMLAARLAGVPSVHTPRASQQHPDRPITTAHKRPPSTPLATSTAPRAKRSTRHRAALVELQTPCIFADT